MKNVAIIGGIIVALGVAAYFLQPSIFQSFGGAPEQTARYTACQEDRCIDVDYFTVSQGCLVEANEAGELKAQIVCGVFIVKQNHP